MAKKSAPDSDKRSMAEYAAAVENLVEHVYDKLGFKVPVPNDEVDHIAQHYGIINALAGVVEKKKAALRSELMQSISVPDALGTHIAHDSAFVIVQAQQVNAPRKLSEASVLNMLIREFALPLEAAQKLVDECKSKDTAFVTRLTVALKR